MQPRHRGARQVRFTGIDMHQPIVQHSLAPAVAGPLTQVGADDQNQIHFCIFHRRNRRTVSGKTKHAAVQGVARADESLGVGRDNEHAVLPLHQFDDEFDRFAAAVAYQHRHLVGLGQQGLQFANRCIIDSSGRFEQMRQIIGRPSIHFGTVHIHGDAEMNRPRCRLIRAQQRIGQLSFQLVGVGYQCAVACAQTKHRYRVKAGAGRFLQRSPAQQMQRGLGGDDQHRDFIFVSAGHTGNQVGGAGPGSRAANADLARFTSVTVGHESRP